MAVDVNPVYFSVAVTSNLSSVASEKRFSSFVTIAELKGKLELITGASPTSMQLQLHDRNGKLVCNLDKDEATLGAYPVQNGFRIHAVDTDTKRKPGEFEDTSIVKKFELSDEEYSKRADSALAFLKQRKLGRFVEKDALALAAAEEREKQEKAEADAITIGSRCEVTGELPKRGTVMYVGKVHFKSGYWVGIKYDEPLGKNDGSIDGKRYFECPQKHGAFIKPVSIKIGNYPEETYSDDEI